MNLFCFTVFLWCFYICESLLAKERFLAKPLLCLKLNRITSLSTVFIMTKQWTVHFRTHLLFFISQKISIIRVWFTVIPVAWNLCEGVVESQIQDKDMKPSFGNKICPMLWFRKLLWYYFAFLVPFTTCAYDFFSLCVCDLQRTLQAAGGKHYHLTLPCNICTLFLYHTSSLTYTNNRPEGCSLST